MNKIIMFIFSIFLVLNNEFNLLYQSVENTKVTVNNNDIITLQENNVVVLKGPINKKITNKFIFDLYNKKILYNNISPPINIYIYIESTGGKVIYGEKIINILQLLKLKNITTNCIGYKAYSMAFHIFQHCENRIILSNSRIMQHDISLQIKKKKLQTIQNYISMINSIKDKLNTIILYKTGLSSEQYNNLIKEDLWLHGTDIIKFKFADEIKYVICNFKSFNNCPLITLD